MRFTIYIFLIFVLSTISCSRDNDDFTILGKWNTKSSTTYTYSNGQLVDTDYQNIPGFTLNSDGTASFSKNIPYYNQIFKWSMKNDTLFFLFEEDAITQKWLIKDKRHDYIKLTRKFETQFSDRSLQFEIVNEYNK